MKKMVSSTVVDYDYDAEFEAAKKGYREPDSSDIHMSLDRFAKRRLPQRRSILDNAPAQPAVPSGPRIPVSEPEIEAQPDAAEIRPEEDGTTSDDVAAEAAAETERSQAALRDEQQREIAAEEYEEESKTAEEDHTGGPEIGSGSSASSGSAANSASSSANAAPEPAPQRDEPDEGEHSSSETAEPVAEPPQPQQQTPETIPEQPPVAPAEDPDPEHTSDSDGGSLDVPSSSDQDEETDWKSITGSEPVTYDEQVYYKGPKNPDEVTNIKRMPKSMIESMRRKISVITGGDFANKIPMQSLLIAFISVKLDHPMDTDTNTQKAMRAFAQLEPRLQGIEANTAEMSSDIIRLGDAVKLMNSRINEMEKISKSVEMATSYIFTDRILGIAPTGDAIETLEIVQDETLKVRDHLRKSAAAQSKIESDANGRKFYRGS